MRTARERAREHAGTRGHAELRQQWACARLAQEQISHFDKPTGEKEGSPLLLAERAIGRDPDAKSNRLLLQECSKTNNCPSGYLAGETGN